MSEKIQVARTSAILGGILALLKLGAGLFSGSLALVSEGIHSSLDFLATLATWLSVRTADVPADREHHYGHGKIENLTAFAQALLLLVTSIWIFFEAIHHLRTRHVLPLDQGWYAAVAVISVAILVDLSRARILSRTAKKYNSQALEADALHFGIELVSSAAVLVGLLFARFGGEAFWVADPLAAMFVAVIMLTTSARLGKRSADVLIDRAPPGLEEEIHTLVSRISGVREVSRIRARQSGARTFVDATITVDPAIALSVGHEIADNAELRVTEKFPGIDILIHVEPATPQESPAFIIRKAAEEMKIELHAVRIHELEGQLYINFHAEFPPEMTLSAAHERVDALEEAIRRQLPAVADITSHIEPEKPISGTHGHSH